MHAGFATVWLTALAVIAGVLGTLEPAHASAPRGIDPAALEQLLERAPALGPVHAIVVSRDGVEQAARAFAGPGLDRPANIKSLSKTVQSALVGIAIDQGVLEGPDQPLADLLPERIPEGADPRLRRVTLDHLLSMRAGLAPTSGAHYGRWVQSQDWVGHVLSRPFVAAPGETMQYSTGVWHLVAAILTERSGESTLLAVRVGLERVIIDSRDGRYGPQMAWPEDARLPLHSGPLGLCLLAYAPPDVLDLVVATGLTRFTSHTVTTRDALDDALAEVRREQVFVAKHSYVEGVYSIGSPILGSERRAVAAIAVVGDVARLDAATEAALRSAVKEAASAVAGYLT